MLFKLINNFTVGDIINIKKKMEKKLEYGHQLIVPLDVENNESKTRSK